MRIKEKLPTPPATTGVSYRELLHQNHQEAIDRDVAATLAPSALGPIRKQLFPLVRHLDLISHSDKHINVVAFHACTQWQGNFSQALSLLRFT